MARKQRRRNITFVIGRLNFVDWKGLKDDYEGKKNFIMEAVDTGKEYPVYKDEDSGEIKYTWAIAEPVYLEKENVLRGRLIKERTEEGGPRYDRKTRLLERDNESIDVKYSSFVLDFNSHIILFEEKTDIPQELFRSSFAQIFNPSQKVADPPIEIDILPSADEILEFIRDLDRLTSFDIQIMPSNPNPWKGSDIIDEDMRQSKIKKLRVTGASDEGIDIDPDNQDDDNFFLQAASQAAAGYGTIKLQGYKKKKLRRLHSEKTYRKVLLEKVLDTTTDFWNSLVEKVKSVKPEPIQDKKTDLST